jgi:hypothetical protein
MKKERKKKRLGCWRAKLKKKRTELKKDKKINRVIPRSTCQTHDLGYEIELTL